MHHGSVLHRQVRAVGRPRSQIHRYLLTKCRLAVSVLFLFSLTACDSGGTSGDTVSIYHSTWSELYPATLQAEYSIDTLQGAFRFAAAAQTPLEAKNRWSIFLTEWDPPNGEFEDAMHGNLVAWAILERRRIDVPVDDPAEQQLIDRQLRALVVQLE
jgi:hypothetical protein